MVTWKHAFKNALIPVVTFVGFYFGILLAGSVVVETVFAWPGIGRLAFEAGAVARLSGDPGGWCCWCPRSFWRAISWWIFLYAYIDPRIRYG